MQRKTFSTFRKNTGYVAALAMVGIMSASAQAAPTFDPVNDQLSSPVVVDDFTDDLSKWDTDPSSHVKIDGSDELLLNPGEASAVQNTDFIPLPSPGQLLVVETTARGRGYLGGQRVDVSNGDGTASAFIRASTGDNYDARPSGDIDNDYRTQTETYPFRPADTFRFIYDNSTGNRTVTLYVKKGGDATFTPLTWKTGGDNTGLVTADNAWSTTDPLHVEYSIKGGTRYQAHDFLRYQTLVPEPASAALFGLGGLAMLIRRRRT